MLESKHQLAAHLKEAGIDYRHLRGLGTPKAGREAARAGHEDEFHRIFEAHMQDPEAMLDLAQAIELGKQRPACLLCFERDPNECHRLIVAERMAQATGQQIRHLFVAD